MKNKILTSLLFILPAFAQAQSDNVSITTKASAILAASCAISAQNVSFGQLNLVALQSSLTSTGSMTLHCTSGSAYTVGLSYGGVYGQGGSGNGNYYTYTGWGYGNGCQGNTRWNGYTEYNASGTAIANNVMICQDVNNGTPAGTTLSNGNYVTSLPSYAYGMLTGAASGDHIQYTITVPGNNSEVWNAGNYSYSGTGTGADQSLPVRATVSGNYPTPDFYSDTVTANVSF